MFVAIAELGTTAAAGAEVALSQSATSSALNELERLLSMRVFDRAGKRLLLNDNGRALLPKARAMLVGASDIQRLSQDPDGQFEALRLGASLTLAEHVLPLVLSDWLGERPRRAARWKSGVFIGNTSEVCERVAAFDLDIGLIEGPCHIPSLAAHRWLVDEIVPVAAPAEAARLGAGENGRPGTVSLDALRAAVWLVREAGSGTREAVDRALLARLGGYHRSIELTSNEAIVHAAASGLGVACLSRWVVSHLLGSGRLVELRSSLPRIARQCYWVLHGSREPTATLQRLIDCLPSAARQLPLGPARAG